jgi:hypothetical protein
MSVDFTPELNDIPTNYPPWDNNSPIPLTDVQAKVFFMIFSTVITS